MRHSILLSGGLDSTSGTLYVIKKLSETLKNGNIDIYSVYYKQNHAIELIAAKQIVEELQKTYKQFNFNYQIFDLSRITPLTRKQLGEVPYYTLRNLILISLAAAASAAKNDNPGDRIFVYTFYHADDAKLFADCTQSFTDKVNKVFTEYEGYNVKIFDELLPTDVIRVKNVFQNVYKNEILAACYPINPDIVKKSWTCYTPKVTELDNGKVMYEHCGECLACKGRKAAFKSIGREEEWNNQIVLDKGELEDYLQKIVTGQV